jgi:hypothetical protein
MNPDFMIDVAHLWQRQAWRQAAHDARVRAVRTMAPRREWRHELIRFRWVLSGVDAHPFLGWCRSVGVMFAARFRA